MEKENFSKQITEAIQKMQPAQPAGMTNRFMERLRKEGVPQAPLANTQPRHRIQFLLSSAAAVAAIVILVVLFSQQKLSFEKKVETAQVVHKVSKPTVIPATTIAKTVIPEKGDATNKVEQSTSTQLLASSNINATKENLSAISSEEQNQPQMPVEPVAMHEEKDVQKVNVLEQEQYTPFELELIAHAEAVRDVAELYTAEIVQESRVLARERDIKWAMQTKPKVEKTIVRKS